MKIGVIGSMGDRELKNDVVKLAEALGKEIAKSGNILLFGYEGDFNSLSEIAARSAENAGGETIAYTWGDEPQNIKDLKSKQINTRLGRGGGREYLFIMDCNAVVALGGGSGTLMEIAMAYQNNIPVFVIEGTGGWSDKLRNTYLDDRKRFKIVGVKSPSDAISSIKDLT